jgi:hypothetical protein
VVNANAPAFDTPEHLKFQIGSGQLAPCIEARTKAGGAPTLD